MWGLIAVLVLAAVVIVDGLLSRGMESRACVWREEQQHLWAGDLTSADEVVAESAAVCVTIPTPAYGMGAKPSRVEIFGTLSVRDYLCLGPDCGPAGSGDATVMQQSAVQQQATSKNPAASHGKDAEGAVPRRSDSTHVGFRPVRPRPVHYFRPEP